MKKPIIGRNEAELYEEFMEKPYWVHTGSEDNWWRILNWMTGLTLEVEFDQFGTVIKYYWSK